MSDRSRVIIGSILVTMLVMALAFVVHFVARQMYPHYAGTITKVSIWVLSIAGSVAIYLGFVIPPGRIFHRKEMQEIRARSSC